MRTTLLVAISTFFCLALALASPLFNSRIELPGHEELIMRQLDDETFRVSVSNHSKGDLHLFLQKTEKHQDPLEVLKAGAETTVKVPHLGSLVIRNRTGRTADITLQGEGNPDSYDMTYQPAGKGSADKASHK